MIQWRSLLLGLVDDWFKQTGRSPKKVFLTIDAEEAILRDCFRDSDMDPSRGFMLWGIPVVRNADVLSVGDKMGTVSKYVIKKRAMLY